MRKCPVGIYIGKDDRRYVAVYNYQHDISVMLPPEFSSAERIARISYSRGNKKGGVDVFLLNDSLPDISVIGNIKKKIYIDNDGFGVEQVRNSPLVSIEDEEAIGGFRVDQEGKSRYVSFEGEGEGVDDLYDVQYQIINNSGEIGTEACDLTRADIIYFCGLDFAKKPRGPRTEYVDKIIPVTRLERVTPERVITPGKQEFVPSCSIEGNIDFGKGCISSWIPGEGAFFDGQDFTDFFAYRWGECDYCYAESKHKVFPKTVYEFDKQRLLGELEGRARLRYGSDETLERPVDILRFGKRTEPWTPFTQNEFVQTLEAMVETGTKGIIITKYLPFMPDIAKLFRRTGSRVGYSNGDDNIELGPVAYGCDNRFRTEQAIRYNEEGVDTFLYILFHPIFPPTNRETELLDIAKQHDMDVQLLPMRLTSRNLASQIMPAYMGLTKHHPWDILRDKSPHQRKLIPPETEYAESYYPETGNTLIPKIGRFHPFWINLVKNNQGRIRLCHHDKWLTYCGDCFQGCGLITQTEHVDLNPNGTLKMRGRQKKGKRVQRSLEPINQNQIKLI